VPPAAPPTDPDTTGATPAERTVVVPGERPGRLWAKVLAGLFLLATLGFWTWLILLAPDQEPPDQLDDPAFAVAAEDICAAAQDDVEALPTAREADSPEERSTQITTSTAVLQQMVDDLAVEAPTAGRDGEMVAEWLGDWDTYLGDRARYAEQLAAGDDVQFQLTAKEGDQVTEAVDGFAEANDMPSCSTPLDV
jgi:hypothetical protein